MRILKKILKRLALGLGILIAVGLVANAILVWQTGKRLEERLSKLRAAGQPLSLPELGAMPVPPGADAAAVLQRILPEIKALSKEMNPMLIAVSDKRPLTDDDWNELEKAIANHPTVLPALSEAAACPSYRSPLNYQITPAPKFMDEFLPSVQLNRKIVNILKYQAGLQLRKKDRDGAMKTCLTSLRIARHSEGEPLMIGYLVTIAVRQIAIGVANEILQGGPIAADLHQALDAELVKMDAGDGIRRSLQSDRAYGLQVFEDYNFVGWLSRGYNNDEKCFYLDQMETWMQRANCTYAEFREYDETLKQESIGLRHTLSRLLIPAFRAFREADFRSHCMIRCLRVLNALTAKKLTEVPANLTDLGLPATATVDPYTEKPLIVKRTDGQWIVYGMGSNLKDDGGKFDQNEDIGLGPIKTEK
jgi:hypothetical protein